MFREMENCSCCSVPEQTKVSEASCCSVPEPEKKNILEKIYSALSSIPAIIVSGVFLAAGLALHIMGIHVMLDPSWVAVIVSGIPLLYTAIYKLINGKGAAKITSSLLISIAMIAAIYIGEYFAAGQVAFIMAIGGLLEEKTIARAKRGIQKLISLVPEQGRLIKDGKEYTVSITEVKAGDILRILPGETIPVDGEIISGNSSVDQSVITGESLPIDKTAGDSVFCGTLNRFGSIDIKAVSIGKDSSLNKLIQLVQEAESKKAPTQLIVDKWAVWLVPLVFVIASVAYAITRNIEMAVTIMIVFCPCALALATPTSIVAAIGQATKHGVIIKSGEALEKMGKVDIIAFDKTGTLTRGELAVSDVISFDSTLPEAQLLSVAGAAESHSEHPLGKAITQYAKSHSETLYEIENFAMLPGKGISADVQVNNSVQSPKSEKSLSSVTVLCGNAAFMEENDILLSPDGANTLKELQEQGKATILVSIDGECKGIIALSDTLREDAGDMVSSLKNSNTGALLLTGDNKQTAEYFANKVGITSIHASLLPAEKVEKIKSLQEDGHHVCMIGDGINDAPALKTANVGVAMGGVGSDIAVDASDIALMGDDISKIPYLKRLSNATVKMIYTNISISIIFNIAALTLSFLSVLNPVTGALAHNAGSIAVVLNAALLYDRKS